MQRVSVLAVWICLLCLVVLSPQAAASADSGAREKLLEAAEDPQLLRWQRDFMVNLAHGDGRLALDPEVSGGRTRGLGTAPEDNNGSWTELFVRSRTLHSAVYDPVRNRMVVFGGASRSGFLNDVWALSLTGTPAWEQLAPLGAAPSPRSEQSAIYDPVGDRVVVFGGRISATEEVNEVWALSLVGEPAWTMLSPVGTPPNARYGHTAIYDPLRDRMVVFGGYDGVNTYQDAWSLSLSGTLAWTALAPEGASPQPRFYHTAIYDSVQDRMVVFGGFNYSSGYFQDAWALPLSAATGWATLTPNGVAPSARALHSAVFDMVGDRMLVFGGETLNSIVLNDVWALSLAGAPTWTTLAPEGTAPGARYGHTAIYDSARGRMVVFGGGGSGSYFADVCVLSVGDPPTWSISTPGGIRPSARVRHSAIYDPLRENMVVFGGFDGTQYLNDTWKLSMAGTPTWSMLTPGGSTPSPRASPSAIYDPVRDRMLVFGGNFYQDVWALSLADPPTWTEVVTTGTQPSARFGQSCIYDPLRDRMVMFGGTSSGSVDLNDLWELSLAGTPTWTQIFAAGTAPSPRYDHNAIYDPALDRMVVFGGTDYVAGGTWHNDLWALSLAATPTWTQLTPSDTPPSARAAPKAIFDPTRGRMVMFGGSIGGPNFTTFYNDVSAAALTGTPMWTALTPSGSVPSGRSVHSAIYDAVRDRMVVVGGASGSGFLNDVWALDFAEPTTAVALMALSTEARVGLVRIHWYAPGDEIVSTSVFRRTPDTDWVLLGHPQADLAHNIVYEDATVVPGTRYGYRLSVRDVTGAENASETWVMVPEGEGTPNVLRLRPARPNPFGSSAELIYGVPRPGHVRIVVYDLQGRRVATLVDRVELAGWRSVIWNGRDAFGRPVASGTYFARLDMAGAVHVEKVVVAR